MGYADILAYTATALNTVMLAPQVIRTLRIKETRDLSLATLVMFMTSSFLWLLYAIEIHAVPVIVANVMVGGMNVILFACKLKYR
jgi:MtN3 and saliva related transmembrane protein